MIRVHVAPSSTTNGELKAYGAPPLSVVPSVQFRTQPTSNGNEALGPLEQVIVELMLGDDGDGGGAGAGERGAGDGGGVNGGGDGGGLGDGGEGDNGMHIPHVTGHNLWTTFNAFNVSGSDCVGWPHNCSLFNRSQLSPTNSSLHGGGGGLDGGSEGGSGRAGGGVEGGGIGDSDGGGEGDGGGGDTQPLH